MMRHKTFALLLAAAMLAGTMNFARAEDESMPYDDSEIDGVLDDDGDDAFSPAVRDRDSRRPDGLRDRDGWRHHRRHDGPRHALRDDDRRGPRFRDNRGPGPRPPRHPGMMMGMGMGMGGRMWDDIALTPEQKTQMVDLLTNAFRAQLEARIEMMDANRKVRDLRDNPDATAEEIIAANAAVGTARGKMAAADAKFRQDLKQVLTPDQFKKLEDKRPGPPPGGKKDRKPGDRRPEGAKDRRPAPPGPRG